MGSIPTREWERCHCFSETPFAVQEKQTHSPLGALAGQFDKQWDGATGETGKGREEMGKELVSFSQGEAGRPPVLGRGTAAQVAAVLGTLNQIIRTQRT